MVVGVLFLAAMFFSPLVAVIPSVAVAPALLLVGALMVRSIRAVNWSDFTEATPALVILLATPLTFSVATGLSLGLIVFSLVKLAGGKRREVSLLIWVLTFVFALRYVYLAIR
jgi:AGZA family xanthine/uracil permease-like MFS transporter